MLWFIGALLVVIVYQLIGAGISLQELEKQEAQIKKLKEDAAAIQKKLKLLTEEQQNDERRAGVDEDA